MQFSQRLRLFCSPVCVRALLQQIPYRFLDQFIEPPILIHGQVIQIMRDGGIKCSHALSRTHRSRCKLDTDFPPNARLERNEHFQAELVPFAAHEVRYAGLRNA